MKIRGQMMTH